MSFSPARARLSSMSRVFLPRVRSPRVPAARLRRCRRWPRCRPVATPPRLASSASTLAHNLAPPPFWTRSQDVLAALEIDSQDEVRGLVLHMGVVPDLHHSPSTSGSSRFAANLHRAAGGTDYSSMRQYATSPSTATTSGTGSPCEPSNPRVAASCAGSVSGRAGRRLGSRTTISLGEGLEVAQPPIAHWLQLRARFGSESDLEEAAPRVALVQAGGEVPGERVRQLESLGVLQCWLGLDDPAQLSQSTAVELGPAPRCCRRSECWRSPVPRLDGRAAARGAIPGARPALRRVRPLHSRSSGRTSCSRSPPRPRSR